MTSIVSSLDVLHICKSGSSTYFGGTQEWYPTIRQRLSGCGPTAASNMLIYLAKTDPYFAPLFPADSVDYRSTLSLMEEIWQYITPNIMGVNKASILANGGLNYSKARGVEMVATTLEIPKISSGNHPSLEDVTNYLNLHISNNRPVAFLNLNAGSLTNLDSWHWVLIVAMDSSGGGLNATVYDEGYKKTINLKKWLESPIVSGGLVSFNSPVRQ